MTITLNGTTGITTPALTNEGGLSGTTGTFSGLISANGGQIKFPASQNASSDANTLDDYEEGTWTPVIESDTPGTGRVSTTSYATYVKIGKQVTVEFHVTLSTLGSGGSGVWVINGLPFSSANAGILNVGLAAALLSNVTTLSGITNSARFVMRIQNGASTSYLGNATFSTYVTGGTYVQGSCTYFV